MDRYATVQEQRDLKNWMVENFATKRELKTEISTLRNEMLNGFDYTYGKLETLTQELTAQGRGLKRVEEIQEQHHATLLRLEGESRANRAANKKAFQRIDQRFESIDQKFESIDQRFKSIDQRFKSIDQRFESVNKRLDQEHRANRQAFARIDQRFQEERKVSQQSFKEIKNYLVKLVGKPGRGKRKPTGRKTR